MADLLSFGPNPPQTGQTPALISDRVIEFFGGLIGLDPTYGPGAHHNAWTMGFIGPDCDPKTEPGFMGKCAWGPWVRLPNYAPRTVYANPPFGKSQSADGTKRGLGDWLELFAHRRRVYSREELGGPLEIIAICPLRPHRRYWSVVPDTATGICELEAIQYDGYDGKASTPQCLIYWGDQWDRFRSIFSEIGRCKRYA